MTQTLCCTSILTINQNQNPTLAAFQLTFPSTSQDSKRSRNTTQQRNRKRHQHNTTNQTKAKRHKARTDSDQRLVDMDPRREEPVGPQQKSFQLVSIGWSVGWSGNGFSWPQRVVVQMTVYIWVAVSVCLCGIPFHRVVFVDLGMCTCTRSFRDACCDEPRFWTKRC